jgi:hypothetical protein
MLKRRTVLLTLLGALEKPITLSRVNLLLALLTDREHAPSYRFIPTKEGPFSIDALHDFRAFEKAKQITFDGTTITAGAKVEGDEEIEEVEATLNTYNKLSDTALLDRALALRPYWGIRTGRDDESISAIRTQIANSATALYTLGYEGLSIDTFVNLLLSRNIARVIDVREYPFSRRSEYTAKNLGEALGFAGIVYTGMPEVGIPTKARKAILADKSKEELLIYYEEEILPTIDEEANRVAQMVHQGSVALICHEEDPRECHRSRFSARVVSLDHTLGSAIDIRAEGEDESGWW